MLKITKTDTGAEPMTLPEVKDYLRVTHSFEDDVISELIKEARQSLEKATNLSVVESDVEVTFTNYRNSFRLPYSPIASITLAELDGEDVSAEIIGDELIYQGRGTLELEYETGAYPGADMAIKEYVAFLYNNRGGGDLPQVVKNWIQNNTMNVWMV